jgi:hypothetical protein
MKGAKTNKEGERPFRPFRPCQERREKHTFLAFPAFPPKNGRQKIEKDKQEKHHESILTTCSFFFVVSCLLGGKAGKAAKFGRPPKQHTIGRGSRSWVFTSRHDSTLAGHLGIARDVPLPRS